MGWQCQKISWNSFLSICTSSYLVILSLPFINPAKSTTGKPIAQAQPGLAKCRALQDLCSVMFNISEFIYVD